MIEWGLILQFIGMATLVSLSLACIGIFIELYRRHDERTHHD